MRARPAEQPGNAGGFAVSFAMIGAALLAVAAGSLHSLPIQSLHGWPFSAHMGQHIILMNAAAPLAALALLQSAYIKDAIDRHASSALSVATGTQLVLLWGWHAPSVFTIAWEHHGLLAAMHGSLFAAALVFWASVFALTGTARWRAIVALLVTGKLFCLLGALLIFAPRPLYQLSHGSHMSLPAHLLEDQQLAGLLMVVACPLTYVVAGVVIAARWLLAFDSPRPACTVLTPARI